MIKKFIAWWNHAYEIEMECDDHSEYRMVTNGHTVIICGFLCGIIIGILILV